MNIFIPLIAFAAITATSFADDAANSRLFSEGSNRFSANLFSEVVKENPGKSVIVSALSAEFPLALLSLGADGASKNELLASFGLPNDDVTRAVFQTETAKLHSLPGVTLKVANKVYLTELVTLNDDFAKDAKAVFNSELQNLDFTKNQDAAKTINSWVETNTNNRIKDLVSPDSLNANTRLVLVNAIYFKGKWKKQFDSALTTDRDFHVSSSKTVKLPTMYKKDSFRYAESAELDAKLLELQYEGDAVTFLAILPNKVDGLAALEEKLKAPGALEKAIGLLRYQEVTVHLPKFRIETTTDLAKVLPRIGVTKIFNSKDASLKRLIKGDESLYVSQATQKAFIEVNEEGAEAAAASEYSLAPGSAWRQEFEFNADYPFAFILKTDSISLFKGVLKE